MGASITFRRRLDWADTDAAGFWHHSSFWRCAEAGEAELARSLGLTSVLFGATPRRSVDAEFHRPVFFDDELTITFGVAAIGRTSVTYSIVVDVGGEQAATGRIVAVLIDDAGQPTPWPDDVATALQGD